MQRLKVGVIGAGGIAQIEHIPNLMKLKRQFEILGVCDPSAKARAFVSEEFGLKVFESIESLPAKRATDSTPRLIQRLTSPHKSIQKCAH